MSTPFVVHIAVDDEDAAYDLAKLLSEHLGTTVVPHHLYGDEIELTVRPEMQLVLHEPSCSPLQLQLLEPELHVVP